MSVSNLFVGPTPISNKDHFFGRESETEELTHLLLAERIVLMYSPSGAGKTSLIEAGVLDEFKRVTRGEFEILPTVRLSLNLSKSIGTDSPFSESAIRCWIELDEGRASGTHFRSVTSFLKQHREVKEKEREGKGVCILVVFDQFEECLTLLPDVADSATKLFEDLSSALADDNIWALFAIREELLGPIMDLAQELPSRFRQTFRLGFLSRSKAQEVIEKTFALGKFSFTKGVIKELVDDIALVNVQDLRGEFHRRPGEYVEPLHLQLVCKYIVEELPNETTEFGRKHLKPVTAAGIADVTKLTTRLTERIARTEQGIGMVSRVDDALAAYYSSELAGITGDNVQQEKKLRFWVEEKLIDSKFMRIPVKQGKEETEGLENAQLDMLEKAYLVRKEQRLNAYWYELAHDRFVQPVLLDNAAWFKRNLGPIAQRYRQWVQAGRHPRFLLNGSELRKARRPGMTIESYSREEFDFIRLSEKSVYRARLRFWFSLAIPLLIGAGIAGILAKIRLDDQRLAYLGQFTALRPLFSQWSPPTLDQNALFLSQLIKEMNAGGTQADAMLVGNFVGLLDGMLQRRGRISQTYWNFQFSALNQAPAEIWSVLSVASSKDGQIAIGDTHGQIRFLRDQLLGTPIQVGDQKDPINTLAFSADGGRLAVGTRKSFVWIFEALEANSSAKKIQLKLPPDSKESTPFVHSCTWNGEGDLAIGCQDGRIYIWPSLVARLKAGAAAYPTVVENRVNNTLVPVIAIAWDPTGEMLAIGDCNGDLRISSHDNLSDPVKAHRAKISSVTWSDTGRLACGSWDHSISVWKIERTGQINIPSRAVTKERAHDQWISDLTWIDETHLVSVGDDNVIKFWKDAELKEADREITPASVIRRVCYSASVKSIVTGDYDGAIRIYNLLPRETKKYGYDDNNIILLAATNSHLVSFDSLGMVGDFDLSSGKQAQFKCDSYQDYPSESPINSVQFYPSLNLFVVGSSVSDTNLQRGRIWVFQPPSEVAHYDFGQRVNAVSCHPKQHVVAFLTSDMCLGLRSLPDLRPVVGQPDIPIVSRKDFAAVRAEWSKDGKFLLVTLNNKTEDRSELRMFQFDSEKLTLVDDGHPIELSGLVVNQLALHPSEPLIALGTTEGAIVMYSLADRRTESEIVSHVGRVTALCWSPDGRRLLSAGDDRSIKVWNYNESREIRLVTALQWEGAVHAIAFSADGKGFYAAGTAPQIAYFPETRYTPSVILAETKKIVNRNMFPAEWARFTVADKLGSGNYQRTFPDLPDLSGQGSR
jgi:WD40 repeat protein